MILIKFVGVGLLVTIVHVSLYAVLSTTKITSPQWANIIAFMFSFTMSYVGQRHVTFAHNTVISERKAFFKFIASTALSFSLNVLWIYLTADVLKINPNFAIIGMVMLTPVVTFMTQKMWVFR